MSLVDKLAKERRARLAAERLLEHKQRELLAANEKLALHARALSDQVVAQRDAARAAKSEAQALKGQNDRFVSDLERAHTAAVMAERRLWDSIETIRDGFAVFDSDRRLVAANRAYRVVFQEHEDPAPGMSYESILHMCAERGIAEIDGEAPDAWVARMLARWDDDPIEPVVVRFSGGRYVRLIDRRARDGDMVTLGVDITEQMRTWAALEAIPDGFVLFDRNDRLLQCNERYRQLYALSAPAIVPGATFEEILRYGLEHGQYAEAEGQETAWLAARLAQHRDPGDIVEQQLSDGRWLRALEKRTPDGGIVGLRVDITEQKQQQAALEEARRAAEAANRAKSAFLANMSHEIRTPMNGVVGMAELLCDSGLTEDQRLYAETIKSSGEALLAIIKDVLDYSKIEADKLVLHPEPFDLERCIHDVTMLLQPSVQDRGIDLLVDFDMFLPTRYVGDEGRVRQVLTNLIGNAVKFTQEGHVLVRVVGLAVDDGAQELHVTVEDTGIGIAPEYRDHIFGEFNQVQDGANRQFEGTGLGLAITRRLVEQMGGEIWVDSTLGEGACFGFRLTLPVAEGGGTEAADPIALNRALVVDDQLNNRRILERQLKTRGVAVTLCRSAAEALEVWGGDSAYDAVIIDHEMPEMDGIALARALKARGSRAPVVLLSPAPGAVRDSADGGLFAAILQKPAPRRVLFDALRGLSLPVATAGSPVTPMRRMRVLTAEDNRTNQLVFRKMTQKLDIDLVIAPDGEEAVRAFETARPDLIFMDISMPGMDGCDAARAIRTREARTGAPPVPIIALTAHAMQGDADRIFAAGIDRYLTKPLRRDALLDEIVRAAPEGTRPVPPAARQPGGKAAGSADQAAEAASASRRKTQRSPSDRPGSNP